MQIYLAVSLHETTTWNYQKSIHVGARFTWDMWKHDRQLKCSSTHIKDCKELTLDKTPQRKWKQINIKIQLKFKGAQ